MQMRRWWTVPGLATCLAAALLSVPVASLAQEQKTPPAVEHKELDATIYRTLVTVINQGADLYNSGDWSGCYRLYEGALLTLRPLLEHHPALQKAIAEGIQNAAKSPQLNDRAFVLRAVIDQIRKELAPSTTPVTPPPPKLTLWDRLGGEKNVTKVVDTFYNLAVNDPRVNFWRKPNFKPDEKKVELVKRQTVEFISSATGGPLEYKGKSMKEVHKGMGITNAEFDAAEADLREALKTHGAQQEDINALMRLVETTRADIVQPRIEPKPPMTVWQRLGGETGVARIVDDFINSATKDPKVNFWRDPKYMPESETVNNLKTKFVEQISTLTGGPLKYEGHTMKAAHRGLGISNAEFDAFLGHVRQALVKHKVSPGDVKFLMDKYNAMRTDIVGMRAPEVEPPKKEDKKPEDKKPEDKKPEDKKPIDREPIKKPEDKKPEDKKADEKETGEREPIKKPIETKPEEKKPIEKEPEDKGS